MLNILINHKSSTLKIYLILKLFLFENIQIIEYIVFADIRIIICSNYSICKYIYYRI